MPDSQWSTGVDELLKEIAEGRGVDFRGYKRSALERRLRKRISDLKQPSLDAYATYLRSHEDEVDRLLETVLINVTEFFRDPQAWQFLRERVFPSLFRKLEPGDTIRAWSAGCATGEEPYSLAIVLAEYFGSNVGDYDVKIYATDIDEDALNVARRAEYNPDRLRHVPSQLRNRYFTGTGPCRLSRDLRRMVIFGRSDLVHDAPISHVQILLCRNALIYFDEPSQFQILLRLHYALENQGVLFLGKAESLLKHAELFEPLNSKWRIFRRVPMTTTLGLHGFPRAARRTDGHAMKTPDAVSMIDDSFLEVFKAGVLIVNAERVIEAKNAAATSLWHLGAKTDGRRLDQTPIPSLCPELLGRLSTAQSSGQAEQFVCTIATGDGPRVFEVMIKAAPAGQNSRMLISAEDVSYKLELQAAIEKLELTGHELQSTNEELEATNEELQSTNEELETTNEELQSANEELETTNEELQSLNEELETTNEELGIRTRELDRLNSRYVETLERIPWPVMLVNEGMQIQFWNSLARTVFGFSKDSRAQLQLEQLPFPQSLIRRIERRCRAAANRHKPVKLSLDRTILPTMDGERNINFIPLSGGAASRNVLVIFGAEAAGVRRNNIGNARADGAKETNNKAASRRKVPQQSKGEKTSK